MISLMLTGLAIGILTSGTSFPDTPHDFVKIADVKSQKLPSSNETLYKVRIKYALISKQQGIVMLGFDVNRPKTFQMLSEVKVGHGEGEVELEAHVTAPDRNEFLAVVNLSEDPHPTHWKPLANDTFTITLTK